MIYTLVEKLSVSWPLDVAKKIQHDFELAVVSYDYQKEASIYQERQKSILKLTSVCKRAILIFKTKRKHRSKKTDTFALKLLNSARFDIP